MIRAKKKQFRKKSRKYNYRIRYPLTSDVTNIKVESYDQIFVANGTNTAQLHNTGTNYLTIASILSNANSFQSMSTLWGRYKITGISIRCSAGQALQSIDLAFPQGAPTASVAFFPNVTAQDLGDAPKSNDQKLFLEPALSIPQAKYYRFPDNYYQLSGYGFGIWSNTSFASNQVGQISVSLTSASTSSGNAYLFNIRTIVYVKLANKNA